MDNSMASGPAVVPVLKIPKLMPTTNVMDKKVFCTICREERVVRIQMYTLSRARSPRFKPLFQHLLDL